MQEQLLKIAADARLRMLVLLVLLALLAYQVSITIWHFVPQPAVDDDFSSISRPIASKDRGQTVSSVQQAQEIINARLFGVRSRQAAPVEVKEDAPETKLNYKLRGIFYSENAEIASVIIEKSRNDIKHYTTEAELEKGITLASIQVDHVLLSRYGKLEKLILEKEEAKFTGNENLPTAGPSDSDAAATRVLKSYKKRFANNPMALAKKFQAIPVTENGQNIGFKLKALRGETLLKKLDFKPEDVFTKINGIGLDKPFQALDALKSLTTSTSASVTFRRNGVEQTLDFKL